MKTEEKISLYLILPIGLVGVVALVIFLSNQDSTGQRSDAPTESSVGSKTDQSETKALPPDVPQANSESESAPEIPAAKEDESSGEALSGKESIRLPKPTELDESATGKSGDMTIEAVQKRLVGVWNGTEDPCTGHVISFDAEGRITMKGMAASQAAFLVNPSYEEGKVKFRLQSNPNGPGIAVIEINSNGTETTIFIVEEIGDDAAKLRVISDVSGDPSEPVTWKRISFDAKPIKEIDLLGASEAGDISAVTRLLDRGDDINAKTGFFVETALMSAAENGHVEIVQLLIKRGADVDAKSKHDRTALMYAARGGDKDQTERQIQIVKLLLSKSPDVNAGDYEGNTALMYAAWQEDRVKIVEMLIESGADINSKNNETQEYGVGERTALMAAASNGRLDTVRLLLAKGADPSLKDSHGDTALRRAESADHKDVANVLRSAGK
jgi:hypothetical protein